MSLPTWILPLGRIFARVTVKGLEHLDAIDGPVIFAANHQSHFDGPVILDSMPPRWRYRAAPAMMKEFFDAHFFPARHTRMEWFTNSLNYYLSALFFNAFPLTQGRVGTRQTLRYMGELVEDGYSILIFPEGRRFESGKIGPKRPDLAALEAAPFRENQDRVAVLDELAHVPQRLAGADVSLREGEGVEEERRQVVVEAVGEPLHPGMPGGEEVGVEELLHHRGRGAVARARRHRVRITGPSKWLWWFAAKITGP